MPLVNDKAEACLRLGLDPLKPYLALLPGSRQAEVAMLAPLFLQACQLLRREHPELEFVVPLVNARRRAQFVTILQAVAPELPIHLFDGQARDVMAAGDAILLASGTATLEAMLVKRPMVVGYKVNALTYWLAERLVNIRTFALPNLLAAKMLVPELIQEACTPEAICREVSRLLGQDNQPLLAEFTRLHQLIRCDADKQAATAVLQLLDRA